MFGAAPSSRGGHSIQSAPLARTFGSLPDDDDPLVRMRTRKGERGDEGSASTDTWVDTDTDTDADDGDPGVWPWGAND